MSQVVQDFFPSRVGRGEVDVVINGRLAFLFCGI